MKVEKKKLVNDDNDLKFTPLDFTNPLQLEKLNLNSLTPANSFDGVSINSDCNNIYIGFPPLGLSSQLNNSMLQNANMDSTKITEYYPLTPYPMNIPFIDLSNTTPITPTTPNTYTSSNNYGSTMSNNNFTTPSSMNNNINTMPNNMNNNTTTMPNNTTPNSMNNNTGTMPNALFNNYTNTPNTNTNNNAYTTLNNQMLSSSSNNSNNEYPSELNSDDLYSYNSSNNRNIHYYTTINPLDILRNFDLSLGDTESRDSASNKDIDSIFNYMQSNNPGVFSTLKAYRIPFPIATLLIKKIIKVTLEHK